MNVSVIIPTKNREKQLGNCLRSLVSQVVMPKEVVVVDNGSIDKTREVVLSFQEKLPIKYVYEPVAGTSTARNIGIKQSKEEIIIFIDDDCIAEKNWTKEILASFNKGIDVVQGKPLEKSNSPISALSFFHVEKYLRSDLSKNRKTKNKGLVNLRSFLDTKNIAIRRKLLSRLNYVFDENLEIYGEDVDLGIRLRKMGISILFNPRVKVNHEHDHTLKSFIKRSFHRGRGFYLLNKKWEEEIKRVNKLKRYFMENFNEEIKFSDSHNKTTEEKVQNQLKREILRGKSLGFKMFFYILLFIHNLIWNIGFNYQKFYQFKEIGRNLSR